MKARVAVDALGGDYGLPVAVQGAVAASREHDVDVLLVGPKDAVSAELARIGGTGPRVTVVDAAEEIGMGESGIL